MQENKQEDLKITLQIKGWTGPEPSEDVRRSLIIMYFADYFGISHRKVLKFLKKQASKR